MLVRPANSPNSVNSFIHTHFYFFKFSKLVAIIFNRFIRWKAIFTKSSILESSPLATWSLGFSTLTSLETCNRQVLATIFDNKVLCSEFCGIAVFSFLVIRFVQLLLFTACWLIAVLYIVILAWKCIFESFTKERKQSILIIVFYCLVVVSLKFYLVLLIRSNLDIIDLVLLAESQLWWLLFKFQVSRIFILVSFLLQWAALIFYISIWF